MIDYQPTPLAWRPPAAVPPVAAPSAPDLNEMVGLLIRELCPATMVVRREHLPSLRGSMPQLREAFKLLLAYIAGHPPPSGTHFLYFKCPEPDVVQFGTGKKANLITLGIFSNLHPEARVFAGSVPEFGRACSLFEANGVTLVHPQAQGDDCIYLLTIAGKPD